jgi:hypothetical protein
MVLNSAKLSIDPDADQVIENVAQKVPDVADQARQFAELAMDLSRSGIGTRRDFRQNIARLPDSAQALVTNR